MGDDLYALDFDGVLCDSCGESSLSAVKAAKARWPGLFDGVDPATEDWIVDQMHIVAEGLAIDGILENWSKIKPVILEEWGENREILVDLFGKVRDEWMDKDLGTWIAANRFYPGVPDALQLASSSIFVVTTKQSRFADALLQKLGGVTIPSEKIYGLGTGPKVEVLKQLQKRPEHQGLKLHFVEDRLATLKNVIKEPELDGWNLYLGDWGYNTKKEREEAASISRIEILQLSDFTKKLK
ncbi:uncharacterized protein LOC115684439 isoform X4 [Syzygium oleosum]|uniref:uncharacterized protein LOC115684439 isoform X4 n=1 Tax=Syzygium oleosum TaxID=219896 RepID=UPI0011D17D48|nr:uncharacterized protein LOC115684439 isoform X4 [Syzygium oleosum]